jgi:isocitrate dehydrogenase kinase/phosphatase
LHSLFFRNTRSYSIHTLSTEMHYTPLLLDISMSPVSKLEQNVSLTQCMSMTSRKK